MRKETYVQILQVSLPVCIVACSKSSAKLNSQDVPLGTISVSINGTTTIFNDSTKTYLQNQAGIYQLWILAYNGDLNGSDQISFVIQSPNPIGIGTFNENGPAPNPIAKNLAYADCEVFIRTYFVLTSFGSITNPATVTITLLIPTSVKETFKGDIKLPPLNRGIATTKGVMHLMSAFEFWSM